MVQEAGDKFGGLTDDELLELLDAVSREVKRRNSLMGPSASVDAQGVKDGLKNIVEALVKR